MKRILHLFLPTFATDCLTRPGAMLAEWRARPLALMARQAGGIRVTASNAAALRLGIAPGLPATDAQAVFPALKTALATPEADGRALAALSDWCRRWSPWTSPEGDRGIWLDVSGCAHLFGGEQAMVESVAARIEALGFAIRAGLADTPGAAWALSHFGDGRTICPEGATRQWLSSFPVAALRLPPAAEETLRKLGIRRIDQLLALPRAPLVARFGTVAALRLDQLLGRISEPIAPRPDEEPLAARLSFLDPIGRTEDVVLAIRHLMEQLCGQLQARGLGARRVTLQVFRVDGTTLAHGAGTNEPVRDPIHLSRLFAEVLNGLDAGFGIEAMAATVTEAHAHAARQDDFEAHSQGTALPLLVDRLTRRLGPGNVYRLGFFPSARPERAAAIAPPLGPPPKEWPRLPRPIRLSRSPEAVDVSTQGGEPHLLRRLGATLPVRHAIGPERIGHEWWRPGQKAGFRDYWRVETQGGPRFWIFRDTDNHWFIHGIFG